MTATDPAVAALVREVLAEELARLRAGVREERVRIAGDADLAAFARRVLAMAGDRGAREAFESGRLVFRLDGSAGGAGGSADGAGPPDAARGRLRGGREDAARAGAPLARRAASSPASHTEVVERGLLSERHVDRLPRETARVRLGPRVRVTPLGRDRLRRRGIAIETAD